MSDFDEMYDDGYSERENKFRIKKSELDELKQYFEMSQEEVMLKSLQLMFDMLQAEKIGWKFGFMKVINDGSEEIFDTDYFPNVVPIGVDKIAMPSMRVNWKEFKNLKIDY